MCARTHSNTYMEVRRQFVGAGFLLLYGGQGSNSGYQAQQSGLFTSWAVLPVLHDLMCQYCIARELQITHLGHKENTGMRIKSDLSYSFTPGNLADSVILSQIHVKKKSIYHIGSNYHFHENVNYIYYQSLVKQSKSITGTWQSFFKCRVLFKNGMCVPIPPPYSQFVQQRFLTGFK